MSAQAKRGDEPISFKALSDSSNCSRRLGLFIRSTILVPFGVAPGDYSKGEGSLFFGSALSSIFFTKVGPS